MLLGGKPSLVSGLRPPRKEMRFIGIGWSSVLKEGPYASCDTRAACIINRFSVYLFPLFIACRSH